MLAQHGAAPSSRDQTIMFLQYINQQPFGTAVRDILTTLPLPSLSDAIARLSAQKLACRSSSAGNFEPVNVEKI